MKKLLSVLLAFALLFGVGGMSAAALQQMPNVADLAPVVLGQPLEALTDEEIFLFTVEQDGRFQFAWNSGDFDVLIFTATAEPRLVHVFEMWCGGCSVVQSLDAGEYLLVVFPMAYTEAGEVHSVTVTQQSWIGPFLIGLAIALVITILAIVPLWWLGTRL